MEERREGGERGREEGGREGGREERGRGKREGGKGEREGGRRERRREPHYNTSVAHWQVHISLLSRLPPPPSSSLLSLSPFSLLPLLSLSLPPPSLFVSPLPLLPSLLTPWVQSLEVVIKSNFEGAIGGLSEEGWDNPGVWWEGGGSRACQQEMGSN